MTTLAVTSVALDIREPVGNIINGMVERYREASARGEALGDDQPPRFDVPRIVRKLEEDVEALYQRYARERRGDRLPIPKLTDAHVAEIRQYQARAVEAFLHQALRLANAGRRNDHLLRQIRELRPDLVPRELTANDLARLRQLQDGILDQRDRLRAALQELGEIIDGFDAAVRAEAEVLAGTALAGQGKIRTTRDAILKNVADWIARRRGGAKAGTDVFAGLNVPSW